MLRALIAERRHVRHEWLIKVDLDTVVMVPRLRRLLGWLDSTAPLVSLVPQWGMLVPMTGAALARYARSRCEEQVRGTALPAGQHPPL